MEVREDRMVPVIDVPGGGVVEDGRQVVIELTTLDGQTSPFVMPVSIAEKLMLLLRGSIDGAAKVRAGQRLDEQPGSLNWGREAEDLIQLRFLVSPDGQTSILEAQCTSGPPRSIRLPARDLRQFATNAKRADEQARRLRERLR